MSSKTYKFPPACLHLTTLALLPNQNLLFRFPLKLLTCDMQQTFPNTFELLGLLHIVLFNLTAGSALQLKIRKDNNRNHNQTQEVRKDWVAVI